MVLIYQDYCFPWTLFELLVVDFRKQNSNLDKTMANLFRFWQCAEPDYYLLPKQWILIIPKLDTLVIGYIWSKFKVVACQRSLVNV